MGSLYSPNAILLRVDSGLVLGQVGADEPVAPASLTKIMTALVTIEECDDLNKKVQVPQQIFSDLYQQNASMAGFLPGERASIRDLLYGVLLSSGAECCETLATVIFGSQQAMVDAMNLRAQQLGMKNTHFCNTTGLDEQGHVSTVRDIATLLQTAIKNSDFYRIFTTSWYWVSPTNQHPWGFTLNSTLFEKTDKKPAKGVVILGGKTGYTDHAGLCLASLAQVNGEEYILVTAAAAGDHSTDPYHILDAISVYSWLAA